MQTLGLMGCWVKSAGKRFGHTMISGDTMWNHSSSARTTVVLISPFLSHLQWGKPTIACIQLSPSFWGMFDWFAPNSCPERLQIPQASFLESKLYSYGFVTVCPHMGYTQQCHSNWNIFFVKNSKKTMAMIIPSIAILIGTWLKKCSCCGDPFFSADLPGTWSWTLLQSVLEDAPKKVTAGTAGTAGVDPWGTWKMVVYQRKWRFPKSWGILLKWMVKSGKSY